MSAPAPVLVEDRSPVVVGHPLAFVPSFGVLGPLVLPVGIGELLDVPVVLVDDVAEVRAFLQVLPAVGAGAARRVARGVVASWVPQRLVEVSRVRPAQLGSAWGVLVVVVVPAPVPFVVEG